VTLKDLQPSTTYYYQCGDFDAGTTSGILTFTTLPSVGDHKPLAFGVIGDLGTTTDSQSTLQHMINDKNLKLILHAGDLSYADCEQPVWDDYGVMIQDLSKER
jgi:phosphodiesterase/alkaline phosphatase D-like protein